MVVNRPMPKKKKTWLIFVRVVTMKIALIGFKSYFFPTENNVKEA